MFQTFVRATTATASGTTEIAGLTAVTGYPEFADGFVDKQLCRYTILDSTGKPLAEEIGEFVSGTNKITRHTALRTWVSDTTFDSSAPSKITLSSGTTYQIECSAGATAFSPVIHNIDATSSSVSRFYISPHYPLRAGDSKTLSAGTCYYMPFLLSADMTVNSLGVYLATAAASSTIKIGVMTCNQNGYIGSKILETTSTIDTSTGGGSVKSGACTATHLPAGWYAVAVIANGGNPTVKAYTANYGGCITPFGLNTAWVTITYRSESPGSYIIPTAASATTSGSADSADYAPMIGLGF